MVINSKWMHSLEKLRRLLNVYAVKEAEDNVVFLKDQESDKSESNLVALDVSVLRVHGGRVPRHVQLGGRGGLYSHILRRGSRHCWGPT